MDVGLAGSGPGIDAVAAALEDADVTTRRCDAADLEHAAFGVVSAPAGSEAFLTAASVADWWLSVEIGGIGGVPLADVDAAVAGFNRETGCYRCLARRVRANVAEPADEPSGDRAAVRLAGAIAGREVVRLLAGTDRISGRAIEVPHAPREFLPVPGCDCESEPPATAPIPREHETVALETAVERAERAIDDRVGIVSRIGEAESFPAPYYLTWLADTTGISDGDAPEQAAGVADDWNAALMKGAGEALERYAGAIYHEADFERAAPAALDHAVAPAAFAGASADAPGGDADESLFWVRGERLGGDAAIAAEREGGGSTAADASSATAPDEDPRVWLPADAVHFPPPGDALPGITTGLGLGTSPVGALLSGLTEVIERDAAMLAWYSTFEPLGLSVDDERFDRVARRARGEGLTVTPLLVTQDVDVPVVTVAVHREERWPRFAVAAAADPSPVAAARGALEEALQNWMELRSTGQDAAEDLDGAIGHYADFPDAARDLVAVDGAVPATSVGPADPPSGEAALSTTLDALADAGLSAYAARLTPRDLETVGLEAVRVVVPTAQPLFTGSPRFGERARSVPADLGFEPRLDRDPHPYP